VTPRGNDTLFVRTLFPCPYAVRSTSGVKRKTRERERERGREGGRKWISRKERLPMRGGLLSEMELLDGNPSRAITSGSFFFASSSQASHTLGSLLLITLSDTTGRMYWYHPLHRWHVSFCHDLSLIHVHIATLQAKFSGQYTGDMCASHGRARANFLRTTNRRLRMRGKLRESRSQLSGVLVQLFRIIFHPVQQIGT